MENSVSGGGCRPSIAAAVFGEADSMLKICEYFHRLFQSDPQALEYITRKLSVSAAQANSTIRFDSIRSIR
jgi:hypothetical protein